MRTCVLTALVDIVLFVLRLILRNIFFSFLVVMES